MSVTQQNVSMMPQNVTAIRPVIPPNVDLIPWYVIVVWCHNMSQSYQEWCHNISAGMPRCVSNSTSTKSWYDVTHVSVILEKMPQCVMGYDVMPRDATLKTTGVYFETSPDLTDVLTHLWCVWICPETVICRSLLSSATVVLIKLNFSVIIRPDPQA